jgi:hypothetical protein
MNLKCLYKNDNMRYPKAEQLIVKYRIQHNVAGKVQPAYKRLQFY